MNRPPPHQNRRLLVVDDNPAIHADFKKILNPVADSLAELAVQEAKLFGQSRPAKVTHHFQVDSALQGQEGLAMVQQSRLAGQPYAMVFMDVRMPPGWDGIETTARIWEVDPDLQIVICTAFSDYSWDEMIERLGISDRLVILKKPFDAIEVIQLAHALTEKWQLLQQARTKMDQLETMVTQRTQDLQTAHEQLKHEIAEHARTDAILRQSQKMEAVGQLAGGIAHDFNNLLTVISGYAQCLALEPQPTPSLTEALQEIQCATERAARLTAQMLMFSRKKRIHLEALELNAVMARLGDMLKRVLGENITLKVACEDTPLAVQADPVMLELVVMNLAVNARDAMPQGGQLLIHTCEIKETTHRTQAHTGRSACISVTDTGCGISPEALPHLFEPFFTTKEVGQGSGLGLSTVYGIVQQHGGWIEVESHPGQGAKFKIFLPIHTQAPKPIPQPSAKLLVRGGPETILLVEDEPVVRRLARGVLQKYGYRVYEAESGEQALAVWNEHATEINLLLTDMVMPGGISGRELAIKLQAQKNNLKITYTSGYSAEVVSPDFALKEGVNFISKPYHQDKLAQTVRNCLDAA